MRFSIALACVFLSTSFSVLSFAEEISWQDRYSTAFKLAQESRGELLIYFAPVTATAESQKFESEALKDAEVEKELGERVVLRLTNNQPLKAGDKEPFAKNDFFRNSSLARVGGYAIISFEKSVKGELKNTYAFHPATTKNAFKSWEADAFEGVLSERITQTLPGTAVGGDSGGAASGNAGILLGLINQHRANHGLNALAYDPSLNISDDGSHANYYSTGLQGRGGAAAYSTTSNPYVSFNMWQNSGGHNAQMLKRGITRAGFGYGNGTNFVGAP